MSMGTPTGRHDVFSEDVQQAVTAARLWGEYFPRVWGSVPYTTTSSLIRLYLRSLLRDSQAHPPPPRPSAVFVPECRIPVVLRLCCCHVGLFSASIHLHTFLCLLSLNSPDTPPHSTSHYVSCAYKFVGGGPSLLPITLPLSNIQLIMWEATA